MSTPVGHSRRHALHDTQSARAGDRVGAELAGEGQAKQIGAAAGDMFFVAGDAEAGAHHPGIEAAASAIIVAHLDRAEHPALRAGPGRPVELGGEGNRGVVRRIAQQGTVIHRGRADDPG
jgi:hypothetical protein